MQPHAQSTDRDTQIPRDRLPIFLVHIQASDEIALILAQRWHQPGHTLAYMVEFFSPGFTDGRCFLFIFERRAKSALAPALAIVIVQG